MGSIFSGIGENPFPLAGKTNEAMMFGRKTREISLFQGLFSQRGLGLAQQTLQDQWAAKQFGVLGASAASTITIDSSGSHAVQPQITTGPETALAWLDRRVEEMRVKL